MAVFKTQIQDIIGDFDDDVAINQFLTDGAKELINMMPPELKEKCTAETTLNNSYYKILDYDNNYQEAFKKVRKFRESEI